MFGKEKNKVKTNAKPIDIFIARRVSEAMNCWAGKEQRKVIITPRKVMEMSPVITADSDGLVVYAYQFGDVTILAHVRTDGYVTVKTVCW